MNLKSASILVTAVVVAGCATTPPTRTVAAAAPAPAPRVYFYPVQGQSEAQQDRDRYECHNWSVKQADFDPSRHPAPREGRATVVPARPAGEAVAAGAVAGAVIGAVVSNPHNAGSGAIIGAVAGGMLGSVAASSEAAEAERIEQRINRGGDSRYEQQAAGYRRALSACLEGRGYAVK